MNAEILVNVTPMEARVAVVENGAAQDVYIERQASRGTVGNIYAGRVVRVLPGMQAAFVDFGFERSGFLHLSDVLGVGTLTDERIADHLREGQMVTVQVVKDPISKKGARLTSQLSVSTRYLVYMPKSDHLGISQRIDEVEERARLQAVLTAALESESMTGGGFIVRTAAEGAGESEILADLRFLKRLWAVVSRRVSEARGPELLYEDLPLQLRAVRDLARPGVQRILVDSHDNYGVLNDFCLKYMPEVADLVELYEGERPIFDLHGVEEDIQRALARVVPLKSGGHLVIDQTEAMTTIDVNTGSFVGRRNQEETLFKTNLEAVSVLARQLRLRNLGGIIIVDFIDMSDGEHRRQVHRALEKAMSRDPARNKISGVSALGLIEMTRKRSRESLERTLCEDCPNCEGRGVLKSAETVCYEILREIMRDARAYETGGLLVLASQAVVERLLDEESAHVGDLESFIERSISFRAEPDYTQEQFDIVLL
ncbi:ribonuclease G [Congregibacter litoralis]|uniref:Ribonuclease G n=1 Tax=Congregibacter litoralis KT71 TaxID=314285 RepID=A4A5B6_9GAMM|nr:ribonuclease G [Congregibacter litoralis]EAQ98987.1 RNAse G [Congregibacter litoralis KT71]